MWILLGIVGLGLNPVLAFYCVICITQLRNSTHIVKVAWLIVLGVVNALPALNLLRETEEKFLDVPLVLAAIIIPNSLMAIVLGFASKRAQELVNGNRIDGGKKDVTFLSDRLDYEAALAFLAALLVEEKRVYGIEVIFSKEAVAPEMSIYHDPDGSAAEHIRQDCIPFVKEMAEKFGKSAIQFEIIYG